MLTFAGRVLLGHEKIDQLGLNDQREPLQRRQLSFWAHFLGRWILYGKKMAREMLYIPEDT